MADNRDSPQPGRDSRLLGGGLAAEELDVRAFEAIHAPVCAPLRGGEAGPGRGERPARIGDPSASDAEGVRELP